MRREALSAGALRAAALLALALAAAPAPAAVWYTIEIIVFEHLSDDGLYSERYPLDPGAPDLAGAVELTTALEGEAAGEPGQLPDSPHAFRLLPPSEFALSGAWSVLRRSGGYRPLLHVAWREPGFGRASAPPAHLTTRLAEGDAAALEPPTVEGTIRLYRSRYLHVEADLLYQRRVGSGAGTPGMPSAFRFETGRRMRSGELHYLDHPLFGLLVKVTPYALPDAEPAAGDAAPDAEPAGDAAPPDGDAPPTTE